MATSEVQIDAAALHAEVSAFAEHINNALSRVTALREKGYIPIKRDAQTGNFFEVLRDGVLLGHLLAVVKPGSLDPKSLRSNIDLVSYDALCSAGRGSSGSAENQEVAKTVFEVTANLNACLKAAKDSGIIVVNIGANDFLEKRVDLMLGLIWQLIRAHLLTNVNLITHPELIRLLGPKESLTTLINVPSETILLRWFNYHLSRAGLKRRIQNFSKDIQDSELYIALLREICPPETRTKLTPLLDKAAAMTASTDEQKLGRAEIVLEAAEVLESREFATARDIATGNARLNLAFTATLFNNHIGIHLPSEEESRELVEKCRMQERRIAELESAHKAESTEKGSFAKKLDETSQQLSAEQTTNETLRKEKEDNEARIQELTKAVAEFAEQVQEDQKKISATDGMYRAYRQTVAAELNAIRGLLRDRFGEASGAQIGAEGSNGDLANQDANDVSSKLKSLIKELLDENKDQKTSLTVLQGKLQKEHAVNEIIGEKIKVYAEDIITNSKRGQKSNGGWKAFLGLTPKAKDDPAALGTKLDKNKSSSTDQIRKSSVV